MIKVLEVIRQGQIGGGESHLLDLIRFFDKKQIEPVCLSFTDGEMISQLKKMGIKCHIIETSKAFDFKIQKQIKHLIESENIQLVHAHGSRAASNVIWPSKQMHTPLIYTVHGWSFHNDQPAYIKQIRAFCEKLICHYSDEIICVSQSNANTGKDTFGLSNCHIIENGINLERFNPSNPFQNLRSEMDFNEKDFIFGFIARCTKQKDPIVFLKALEMAHQQNKNIKGLFVGEGDMDEDVDNYIKSYQMENYLHRTTFRTDVPELLHAIDAYCLPSLWEGLSIALLEAMAMEKAIIATPTDGTNEVIHDKENGLIIPFQDANALASAMIELANSPDLCSEYGQAARCIVEKRFNAKRVAETVTDLYFNTIRNHQRD